MSVNKVILIGNLGGDVKLRYFDNGGVVCRFSLTTSETYSSKSGEKIIDTEWHSIVASNKLAELCNSCLSKGDKIYLEGKIKKRKWQDTEGNDRYTTEVRMLSVTFLHTKNSKYSSGPFSKNTTF
ncbi:single-stranded DNA-binding protein [Tenacibaculum maritimum]|uniref:single-stranded DNA-binding protein n=1 Tax=Tenacibaculum maritimum TaxID=107401 RepID=UPI0012E54CCF|nr:single-stranded DNA-binding protein [Tenacibaculum maritimum]MDB0602736.1 single-stranded DNA-binding protein [Tenacibaculum maritimum]MDB0612338.1 single-stranded DNA-binding protein [Tenacibaculum maritimum]CAA0144267.1 Single-stranded DNA-binding protein [Tenacibaculum maritimum]CAA0193482.1 Single-stranded DNA-binding protein [Tenacibaculum maritimum]CAA0196567.1 Single-stranded DNA-binding protein [Tenacibaculum maritimum]